MRTLRHAHEVSAFLSTHPDPAVTALVQQRLSELLADDGLPMEQVVMEQLVFFVIPEPGDTLQQLVNAIGTDLLTTDGCPLWEFVEEHPTCYEFVIVVRDDGFGAIGLISKMEGIDPELLALCSQYAIPANQGIDP